jgi:hypothetical protein
MQKVTPMKIAVLVILTYFCITSVIYILSVVLGYNGITIILFNGGDDGFKYWQLANDVSQGTLILPWSWIYSTLYVLSLGNLLHITGIYSPYIIRIFNQVGIVMLVYYVLEIINLQLIQNKENVKYENKTKIISIIFILLYSSLQMNTNLSLYRDIWIFSFFIATIVYYIKLVYYRKSNVIILFCLSLFILFLLRAQAALAVTVSILLFHAFKIFSKYINWRIVFLFLLIAFGIYYTFLYNLKVPIVNMTLSQALYFRIIVGGGGSNLNISLNQPNYILFILNYFHSFIANLVGPLPWHISGWSTLSLFFIETIPMIFILCVLFVKRRLLTPIQKYMITTAFVWLVMIAVTNNNMGTAVRLRVPSWILLFCVFAEVSK